MKSNRFIRATILALGVSILPIASQLNAQELQIENVQNEQSLQNLDVNQVSESFGHLIKKNIESLGLDFDVELVIKGIEDAVAGKQAPLDENECIQAISLIQENAFQKQSSINLQLAEEFMATNRMNDDIIELEDGKVQYQIMEIGAGDAVEADFTPTIRYTGEFADGSVFASSKEDEVLPLTETIPGLAKAIIGMREGEKRTAYIHPEFAYGDSGYMPPNSLLTFHIELVKANTPMDENEDMVVDQSLEELALQDGEQGLR